MEIHLKRILFVCWLYFLGDVAFADKEHVHFKIHVPEIIKHHIHTKTVFIHIYEKDDHDKHKKKPHHNNDESYIEDWTAWRSYQNNNGDEENRNGGHNYKKLQVKGPNALDHNYLTLKENELNQNNNPYLPQEIPDNLLISQPLLDPRDPNSSSEENDGLGYQPINPHIGNGYAIYEDIKEESPPVENDVHYNNKFEEGYHKGSHSETGHVFMKHYKDFFDKENEQGENYKGGYQDDSFENFGRSGKHDKKRGYHDRAGKNNRKIARRFFVTRVVVR